MNSLLRPTLASSALLLASIAFAQGNSGNAPGQNKPATPANPAAGGNAPASPGNSGQSTGSANAGGNTVSAGANANAGGGTTTPGPNSANAGGTGASAGNSAKATPHNPNPNASDSANAIQAVLQKFDASRDKIVNDRKALIDQLAAAKNDSERQAVLAQLKAEEQNVQDQQRATAKEIRAELQALRRQRSGR